MMKEASLRCDGCGQLASAEHMARRLRRLEWATRYRPIHIGILLLGAVAPLEDRDFLYAPSGEFGGEAVLALQAARIASTGKPREAVLAEFQRGGFFLVHVLECPLGHAKVDTDGMQAVLEQRIAPLMARIRRSLKPKKLLPISPLLNAWLQPLKESCNDLAVLES